VPSFRDPSKSFMDAYAACAVGLGTGRGGWTGYGHEPTRGEFRRVCMTVQFLGWYRAQLAAGP